MRNQLGTITATLLTIIVISSIIQESVFLRASLNNQLEGDFEIKLKPVGTAGIDWTLENILTDTQITFSNYKGKVILMDFFATWCAPCQESMAEIREVKAAFSSSTLVIISVDSDTENDKEADIEEFASTYQMDWKIVRDTVDLSSFYEVYSIPTFYLFDQDQKVSYSSVGSVSSSTIISKIRSLISGTPTTPSSNPEPLGFWVKNWYWFAILTIFIVIFTGVFYQRSKVIKHNKKI
ncbi:MAG TPA: TlpA disulfide reductase family protein [Candidatus Bathyarchaeia archaeon]|nr:TlpA disulfide reductase family protein [Candidatus Bathyarchaeia archaeon]